MSQPVTGYGTGYLDEYTDHSHPHPLPHAQVPSLSAAHLRLDTPSGASLRLESLAQALRFESATGGDLDHSPTHHHTSATASLSASIPPPVPHIMSGHHYGPPAGNMSAILDSICANPVPITGRGVSLPVSVFNSIGGGSGRERGSMPRATGLHNSNNNTIASHHLPTSGNAIADANASATSPSGGTGAVRKPTKSRRSRKRPTGWKPMPRELRVYKKCDYCGEKNHVRQLCCKYCYKSKADMKKIADRNRRGGGGASGSAAGVGASS